jgi:hypothetical protein
MRTRLEKIITKKLYEFEMAFQNSIFAKELYIKLKKFFVVAFDKTDVFAKKLTIKIILLYKFLNGRNRKKYFLFKLLDSFSKQHELLFSMIEFKEFDKRSDEYQRLVNNIKAIMRANKRFNSISKSKASEMKYLLSEYIMQKRFVEKYGYN